MVCAVCEALGRLNSVECLTGGQVEVLNVEGVVVEVLYVRRGLIVLRVNRACLRLNRGKKDNSNWRQSVKEGVRWTTIAELLLRRGWWRADRKTMGWLFLWYSCSVGYPEAPCGSVLEVVLWRKRCEGLNRSFVESVKALSPAISTPMRRCERLSYQRVVGRVHKGCTPVKARCVR